MPLSLKTLQGKVGHARVDLGEDDIVNVSYYTAKITQDMMDQAVKDKASGAELLHKIIRGWDIVDTREEEDPANPAGEPKRVEIEYPPTLENIRALPIPIVSAILDGIIDSFTPKSRTSEN